MMFCKNQKCNKGPAGGAKELEGRQTDFCSRACMMADRRSKNKVATRITMAIGMGLMVVWKDGEQVKAEEITDEEERLLIEKYSKWIKTRIESPDESHDGACESRYELEEMPTL